MGNVPLNCFTIGLQVQTAPYFGDRIATLEHLIYQTISHPCTDATRAAPRKRHKSSFHFPTTSPPLPFGSAAPTSTRPPRRMAFGPARGVTYPVGTLRPWGGIGHVDARDPMKQITIGCHVTQNSAFQPFRLHQKAES
jgi:hypothetical protein